MAICVHHVGPQMWGQIINHSRTDGGDILSHCPRTDARTRITRSQCSCLSVCHHHTCAWSFAFSESGCPEYKLLFDLWCSFAAVPFVAVWQPLKKPFSLSGFLESSTQTIVFFRSRRQFGFSLPPPKLTKKMDGMADPTQKAREEFVCQHGRLFPTYLFFCVFHLGLGWISTSLFVRRSS